MKSYHICLVIGLTILGIFFYFGTKDDPEAAKGLLIGLGIGAGGVLTGLGLGNVLWDWMNRR
jgi:hypothetical protein